MNENKDLTGKKFGKLLVLKMVERKSNRVQIKWVCKCDCGKEKKFSTGLLEDGTMTCCGCTKPKVGDDITGMKFGKLTAIEYVGMNKNYRRVWLCKCECDNEKEMVIDRLISGNSTSCGCSHFMDLTGRKFNRLTALECLGKNKHGNNIWKCKCDCGNFTINQTGELTTGAVKSCGCYRDEKTSEMARSKRGANHHSFDPTMTPDERELGRKYTEYNDWRFAVYRRDNRRCIICSSNKTVHAHHVFSYKDYKGLRLDIDNGISLCEKCHTDYHSLFGNKTSNLFMFIEYLQTSHSLPKDDPVTKMFKSNALVLVNEFNLDTFQTFRKEVKKENVNIYLFIIMYLNHIKSMKGGNVNAIHS